MTTLLAPEPTDVRALVEDVWSSFLGADDPLLPGAADAFDAGWTAAVTVTGAWAGTTTIALPASAAEAVTRAMLGVDEPTEEDVADAVGELVNMIGGNVKSLMPGPSALSLPVVATGHVAHPSGAVEACRVESAWAGHPVVVCVHVHP